MAFNPKLKINLLEVFNRNFSSKPYEVRRALREVIRRADFMDDFGLRAIDVITERTQSGVDRNGDSFAPYSKSYKDSFVFEVYGKGSKVDLKLSGEMLASMQVKRSGDQIAISFVDDLNAAKAHGHITGMSGRKGGVVRDFFGINDQEADDIMKSLMREYMTDTAASIEGRALQREVAA